ncbi:tryptophan 7-halogenase [Streptomyces gardneri]|uniref:tryptophan halogenase family protein n=1 Tax=Nocardia TaxID=1817 RepID=UPI00135C55E3|nr:MULTISPECIES: tryptophan halogenase family protein [Nocardia]MBF6169663.1 tryptophan 7-halogenase [Streptomyces gardneri]MBF6204340.1 tryptophan 7-halogenase [Streptomyces gardneri]UAK30485.1 tryptophan 7-halogenase [Nocardia asteroides]
MNDNRINKVVVLGGGTAGWMTASYLGKALGDEVSITVLEAPAIPKIGVGEATVPNLHKTFFDFLGLTEEDWMRECNASFKMGIKFINWRTPGVGEATGRRFRDATDHYYHLFGLLPNHANLPLSHYWVNKKLAGQTDEPFDYACYREPPILDKNLAPRHVDGSRWTNYAWHFDANLVADFLRRFAVNKQGAVHVQDEMTEVVFDQRGYISALKTKSGRVLEGDLFIDCSGFRGLLINQAMREPFLDMSEHLLNDSAVATAVPHDDAANGIEPYTSAIAMSSGWTWKIPMLGRFGTGYVYSSRFQNQDDATEEFCRMWNLDPAEQPLNQIRFRVGRNRRAWVKNCVSIGLSGCFLEPLESTGIYFITASLYQLAKHFPDRRFDQVLVNRFNREIETMFDDSRDFIQAHFTFAPREDTPFWKACKELELADDITEKIAMYRAGLAVNMPVTDEQTYYANFEAEFRNYWTNSSYYCIFAGLGLVPDHPVPALAYRPDDTASAEPVFAEIKQTQQELLRTLPSTYEYLRQLHAK